MDRAAIRNIFFPNNNNGLEGSSMDPGIMNPFPSSAQQGHNNNTNKNNNGGDGDAARALEIAGYPTLLQEYLWQQQQQQDHAAATMESRLALAQQQNQFGANGFMSGNNSAMLGQRMMNPFGGSAFGELEGMNQLQQQQAVDPSQLLFERLQAANALSQPSAAAAAGLPSALWGDASGLSNNNALRAADKFAANGILGPWSERSAGLLGSMVATGTVNKPTKVKKGRRKQPKDKPKRPLSAYNIFFKEERARLLQKLDDAKKEEASENGNEEDEDKKPPSKIGFENLAKIIGSKWQDLTPTQVEYYKEKAGEDMKRYKSEMETYLAKQQSGKDNSSTNADGDAGQDDAESSEPAAKKQKV